MSPREKGGKRTGEPPGDKRERLTLAEFKRLIERAQERGEDTTPLIRRLVLQTIDDVQQELEAGGRTNIAN